MKSDTRVLTVFFFIFFFSCSESGKMEVEIPVGMATRLAGLSQGTTFRLAAYSRDGSYLTSGAYCLLEPGKGLLTPSSLDERGRYLEPSPQAALTLPQDGSYRLVCISPGYAPDEQGLLHFSPGSADFDLKLSDPQELYLGDYGIVDFDGLMKEPRAKMTFDFYFSGEPGQLTITADRICLLEAPDEGDEVTYHPLTRELVTSTQTGSRYLALQEADARKDHQGYSWCYRSSTGWVPSGIYKRPLRLVCEMDIAGQPVKTDLPLTGPALPELEPQHHYHFKILISNTALIVDVSICEACGPAGWEKGGTDGAEISQPGTVTVRIGWWQMLRDYFWKSIRPEDQIID